ncbi:MAG: hypothetical protein LBC88_02455 [Spirochaetaceae bacterium]|jgi:hypothetical protein|nr:hypothetical protein [Spirochaetaceae bacterium]
MTGAERREARYERRKARRETKRNEKLNAADNFSQIIDTDNLYSSFKRSRRGVAWKESVQRYEANALRNIAETRRKLIAGESVQSGFVEFDLRERGKTRHIKSVHISERIVQKCLCDYALVPILSRPLIYDNGASMKSKGEFTSPCAASSSTCAVFTGITVFPITAMPCWLTSQSFLTT